jgi:hypothetical protein
LYKYNAGFARINYNWEKKYILSLNGRRDGSSRFGDNNKFHNFGSVGLAWIFTQEKFAKKIFPFLSFGKFRGSFGTTGNDQIGDYRYYDLFNPTLYTYQNITPLTPSSLNNPNIEWEKTKKYEVSADLGFLKGRILINTSYYFNESSNQLVGYTLPATTGFSIISSNFPATIQNYGWEFSLNTINLKSNTFSWSSDFNLTLPKNKLAAFPDIENSPYKSSYIVGKPITSQLLYHATGVNDSTGAYQFSDVKGNLTYAPNSATDRIIAMNTSPQFYGGLGNSFNYKGFQLDFLFQFTKQMGKNYLFQPFYPPGRLGINTIQDALSRWQNIGDQTSLAKFTQSGTSDTYRTYQYVTSSDLAYTDASFIRLKNLSFSYNLQTSLSKKLHLQNCKVYVLAQNVFTITNYKGADPETKSISALPPLRVITGGVNVSF